MLVRKSSLKYLAYFFMMWEVNSFYLLSSTDRQQAVSKANHLVSTQT